MEGLISDKLNGETIKLIKKLLANLDNFDGVYDHIRLSIEIGQA